ncbi:MAG: RNA polymerase sigma factor RpoD/SigA [Spirochaetes bacterium]|nr:RNA polymerase sigma factor RpoD/SigA [Spirochaetota bacterium]MBU0953918.1 RNA polymerase sigma factor RpoD/SigA [Spirochaetota bacterium]
MKGTTKTSVYDDSTKLYYERVKTIALLSAEEERELSRCIQAGDEAARTRMIEANLRLVIKIARSYANFDIPLIDIVQEGNLGLIKAAERFDYRRNVRFSTYASWWIRQSITRSLVNSRRAIRLPHRKEELIRHIHKAFAELAQFLGREPSHEEIAKELDLTENEIRDALEMSGSVVSIENTGADEDSASILDVYEDKTYAPYETMMQNCLKERTMSMLQALMERERLVLMARFDFINGSKNTLKGIGENLGLSAETIRQIEKRALRKLRAQSEELREYVY